MRDIHIYEQIGARLRTARAQSKLTLHEAALALGVSIGHLSAVERGKAQATVGVLMGTLELYGVGADQILYGQPKWMSCPSEGRTDCHIIHMHRSRDARPSSWPPLQS